MATVHEECTKEEKCYVVRCLWAKGLNARDIHKEMFHVYGGKCLSHNAVHCWEEKVSQERSKVADDARPSAEMPETTVKRLLYCGFRRTGKAMGHVSMLKEDMSRNKSFFFHFRI
jgi:hypothetical protein